MRGKFTRNGNILAIALVAVLAAVGVGYAAIPSADGVIHSCYNAAANPSGGLRVIDTDAGAKCSKNEKALNFNQTGPQGPQGIQGVKGDKGDQGIQGIQGGKGDKGDQGIQGVKGDTGAPGAAGTSDVHQASNGEGGGPLSVSVPAGTYLVVANGHVGNFDADFQTAVCSLNGTVVVREILTGDSGGEANLPILGTVVLASPGTITIDCGGFGIYTFAMRMFVTKVTSVING